MIKNETYLTPENIGKFQSRLLVRTQIFTLILCIVVVACGIVEIVLKDYAFGIFCTVFGTAFFPIILYIQKLTTKKTVKMISQGGMVKNVYEFDDKGVTVVTYRGETKAGESVVAYEDLYRIEERDKYYYIYVANNQAFIVDKSSFTEGTSSELSILLATHMGEKYAVKLSKKLIQENKKA
ncbi:MAG: YcxB family protein [Clostridia bacterium]|nr:YcxB family protein [Clostridia bacterium]